MLGQQLRGFLLGPSLFISLSLISFYDRVIAFEINDPEHVKTGVRIGKLCEEIAMKKTFG
jgi:hypothetical protein